MSIRKVGGIWFARVWRIRVSFCLARAPAHSINTRVQNYERFLNGGYAHGGR
jgi:hypothetical protein